MTDERREPHDAGLTPIPPTPEKQAELDAEAGNGENMFDFDLSTPEGALAAMRPAAVMLGIQGVLDGISTIILLASASTLSGGVTWTSAWMLVVIAEFVAPFVLCLFVGRGSPLAAILAALWMAYTWFFVVMNFLEDGSRPGILYLILILVMLPGVVLALTASFTREKLLKQAAADKA